MLALGICLHVTELVGAGNTPGHYKTCFTGRGKDGEVMTFIWVAARRQACPSAQGHLLWVQEESLCPLCR